MEEINKIALGQRIKQIRLEIGETMEEFGARLDTSKGTVNNWEKGRNLPNNKTLLKIAKLKNITVEELLYPNDMVQALIDENARLRDEKRRLTKDLEEVYQKPSMVELLIEQKKIPRLDVVANMHLVSKEEAKELRRKLWNK